MSCNNGMSFFPSNFMIQASYEDDHPHQSPSLAPLLPSCSIPQDLNGIHTHTYTLTHVLCILKTLFSCCF